MLSCDLCAVNGNYPFGNIFTHLYKLLQLHFSNNFVELDQTVLGCKANGVFQICLVSKEKVTFATFGYYFIK